MQISANLPDTAIILEAVLEGFVRAAAAEIAAGLVGPFPDEAGVKYVPEAAGKELWKLPHETERDGQGDCEDLALWEAAGLRVTGQDPSATVVLVKTGKRKMHAVVMLSDGSLSDPSARLRVFQESTKRHSFSSGWLPSYGVGAMPRLPRGSSQPPAQGGVRVIARNGVDLRTGKQYVPPASHNRAVTPQEGVRVNRQTGEVLPNDPNLDNAPPGYPPGGYFPGGYPPGYPPGYGYGAYPPPGYQTSSPYGYGDPYGYGSYAGYSSDYWGTGGDSPYGWQYGNGPLVTYESLYGSWGNYDGGYGGGGYGGGWEGGDVRDLIDAIQDESSSGIDDGEGLQ